MKTPHTTNGQTVQRVKVGLIGLAAVILLIGLASAIFSAANRSAATIARDAGTSVTLDNATLPAEANEPLAELGVAPAIDANVAAPQSPRPR